jgi:hypothetical protein
MDDDHPADIGRPRRRGDRITPLFCCGCLRPVTAQSGRKETSAICPLSGGKADSSNDCEQSQFMSTRPNPY